MIQLAAALLCDSANVRENLLNVLSGGITVLGRPSFPAPIGVDLALSFYVYSEDGIVQDHPINVIARDNDGEPLFEFETGFSVTVEPGSEPTLVQTASLVVPVSLMGVPEPGMYWIDVVTEDRVLVSVPFKVEPTAGE